MVLIVLIAVSGGLLASVVAAVAAQFRLEKQLDHERQLHDLDEARNRLDEVIDMGEAALSAVCEAREAYSPGGPNPRAQQQLQHAYQCLGQYGYKERRLQIRIGIDHELVEPVRDLRQQVQALHDLVSECVQASAPIAIPNWQVRLGAVAVAQHNATRAGVDCLGVKLQ